LVVAKAEVTRHILTVNAINTPAMDLREALLSVKPGTRTENKFLFIIRD
jgi:hypothetical protein